MFSCSSDGAILNWTVLENCLVATLITVIPFTRQIKSEVGATYVLIQLLSLTAERNGTEHGRKNTLRYLCRFMLIILKMKKGIWSYLTILETELSRRITQGVEQELCLCHLFVKAD